MKYLSQFLEFCWMAFAKGKKFTVTGVRPWTDFQTKQPLGWIVDVAITADTTPYKLKDGESGSNLFEKIAFKCTAQPMVGISDEVVPVNPVCTIWGEYRNNLSVKCDAVVLASTVTAPAGKEKN